MGERTAFWLHTDIVLGLRVKFGAIFRYQLKTWIFLAIPKLHKYRGRSTKGSIFQGGFQHESNGNGGKLSRNTNYLYGKPILVFYDQNSRYGLQFSSKIWAYVNNDDTTNPDLKNYRVYFDLEAKFGQADSFVVSSLFRWADQRASIQLDFSYPLDKVFFRNLDIYFYAQYVDTLAESLLDYENRTGH